MRISGNRSTDAQTAAAFTADTESAHALAAVQQWVPKRSWSGMINTDHRDAEFASLSYGADRRAPDPDAALHTLNRADDGQDNTPALRTSSDNAAAAPLVAAVRAPHIRDSWDPQTGTHTRDAWDEQSGKHIRDVWDASGTHVRDTLDESTGRHLHDVWAADGTRTRDSWDENGNHLREAWAPDGEYRRDMWNELERRIRNARRNAPTPTEPQPQAPTSTPPDDTTGTPDASSPGTPESSAPRRPVGGSHRYRGNGVNPGATARTGPANGTNPCQSPTHCAPTGPGGDGRGGNDADSATGSVPPANGDDDSQTSDVTGGTGDAGRSAGPDRDAANDDRDDASSLARPAGEPRFLDGFTDRQRQLLRKAARHTKRMVDAALARIHRTGGLDRNYQNWFGFPSKASVREVERVLTNIQRTLANGNLVFAGLPRTRDNWEMAHVFPAVAGHRIYIRPHLFDYPFGPKTLEATIAHELSHFNDIGGTKDLLYGPHNVHALANRSNWAAAHNAENYGMFIRSQDVA